MRKKLRNNQSIERDTLKEDETRKEVNCFIKIEETFHERETTKILPEEGLSIIETIHKEINSIEDEITIDLLPGRAEMGESVLTRIADLYIQVKKDINPDKDAGQMSNAEGGSADLATQEMEIMKKQRKSKETIQWEEKCSTEIILGIEIKILNLKDKTENGLKIKDKKI